MTTHFSTPTFRRSWQELWLRPPDNQRTSDQISRFRAALLRTLGLRPELPMQVALAASRAGRVALHAFCLVRRPSHARWHWQGILREFRA